MKTAFRQVRIRRHAHGLVAVCLVSVLTGCKTTDPGGTPRLTLAESHVLYTKVISAHNERVGSLERFWARAVVEARWTEADGRKRFEQGDGHLILAFPNRAALTIGKLGQVKYWAGSDAKQYWLFDGMAGDVLSVGRTDAPNQQGRAATQHSPLMVKPSDIPNLMAMLPLPELPANSKRPFAQPDGEQIIIDVPDRPIQLRFDSASLHPIRVTLFGEDGKPMITADLDLSRYERMEKENAAVGPYVPRTVDLKLVGRDGRLTVYLSDPTDVERRVKDRLFELEFLKTVLKPKRIVDLDRSHSGG